MGTSFKATDDALDEEQHGRDEIVDSGKKTRVESRSKINR